MTRKILSILLFLTAAMAVHAQIKIGGNVYGGGNKGDTGGNTTVTVRAGDLDKVFGGACEANVGGSAFVNIDSENDPAYTLINHVYGGNDRSGTIKGGTAVPEELEQAARNGVDNTWNAFVRIGPNTEEKKIYIGQLFGGGNGDYDIYNDAVKKPELERTYLEITGGSMVYAFGGGNNATVTKQSIICVDNQSQVVNSIEDANGKELLTTERLKQMGFNIGYTHPTSDEFQIGSFFGGNNKAEMAIRPTWNLQRGKIRNVYSGGNMGAMTSTEGLLLEINPDEEHSSELVIDNVYGGCRRADVIPGGDRDNPVSVINLTEKDEKGDLKYHFPDQLSARVLIRGGDINNVYGGNDISGRVYGGNAVGVYSSIRGDVYGGGNGSYPYTDNPGLKEDATYGELYYDKGDNSLDALNAFRPNAEQVSIHLSGKAGKPTIIGGSVFVGGNSATLKTTKEKPRVELKIGSHVIADKVFLGNNGENMVNDVLQVMASKEITSDGTKFSSIELTTPENFARYMEGCAMDLMPDVVFDSEGNGDPATYEDYTSNFGSFYCGGNVGSMTSNGLQKINFTYKVIIFNKLVGGCNNANVDAKEGINAAYTGGLTGQPDENGNKVELNLSGLKIQPKRWKTNEMGQQELVWNTFIDDEEVDAVTSGDAPEESDDNDLKRRFQDGNIYGGCYTSGYINGNVVININGSLIDRDGEHGKYGNVFGGGKGKDTEIWGSTTINLKAGYTFQLFGGSQEGVIGKSTSSGTYTFNNKKYEYTPQYSCTVNLCGQAEGAQTSTDEDMPECEFIYAGGFLGPICGNTTVNLGNGRVFNSFGGSCNADILGHTETYIGRQLDSDGNAVEGFPYIRDYVYGGNDFGGSIRGSADFTGSIRSDVASMVHSKQVAKEVSAYTEYRQGNALGIFGGCYGTYDYANDYQSYIQADGFTKPRMDLAFVNFRPTHTEKLQNNENNLVREVYGAGRVYPGDPDRDIMQQRSYILVDIPQAMKNYADMQVWGAGAWSGLGMRTKVADDASEEERDAVSAIIDLTRGQIDAAYGASYREGFTRRTVVNVPEKSTIKLNKIFGGGYGDALTTVCDAYEANVNYHSSEASVSALYGGNNTARRTLYARMNIDVPVFSDKTNDKLATVYGAGYGENTWAQYTEVNLLSGAEVYEFYGGGENGRVINRATIQKFAEEKGIDLSLTSGGGDESYEDPGLTSPLAKKRHDGKRYNTNVMVHRGATILNYAYGGGKGADGIAKSGDVNGTTYTAVLGGTIKKDLYAAGTMGAVLDEFGHLKDDFGHAFVAGTTAYIAGGTVRNIYGGGWKGSVGKHKKTVDGVEVEADIEDNASDDIPGETHVIIGIRKDQPQEKLLSDLSWVKGTDATTSDFGFYNGLPTIQRNAYAGGEGGAVYGEANLVLNNGYIGYEYILPTAPGGSTAGNAAPTVPGGSTAGEGYFSEKIDDETYYDEETSTDGTGRLRDCGNIFGGGYDARSSVDRSNVIIYGGEVRGSLHGGGEIATIGRGSTQESGTANHEREFKAIYQPGKTHIELYNGHIHRNVFGGGKGYNLLGYGGSNELYTDGYTFGQTEVFIYGGEVGTADNVGEGYGNVFGGGDLGYVYSRGYDAPNSRENQTGSPNHWFYYDYAGNLTEDCRVVVTPRLQVKPGCTIEYDGQTYKDYDYVPTDFLNTLPKKEDGQWKGDWQYLIDKDESGERGVIIRNAVFGGGNVSSNSDRTYANATTVFGNTTATLYDVYHRDFITVGTEHTGGLYGGGNLSVVDGYRELNITNYGTDYYSMSQRISLEEYQHLSNRERAYFQLLYECVADNGKYNKGDRISEEDYNKLEDKYQDAAYWQQYGFCSIYAGRLLNTIQRADFCAVYGSRMVLQGAKDRVAEIGEDIDYTINRVTELSLNKNMSSIAEDKDTKEEYHGNYFGIYSIVNYLGNLTSDVRFNDVYVDGNGNTDETILDEIGKPITFYTYKRKDPTSNSRNIGTSYNEVALASGVFLELTTEKTELTPGKKKEYGYISGIVELDLINTKQITEGGGFVYAKNEHRVAKYFPNKKNVVLSSYNHERKVNGEIIRNEARSHKRYCYSEDDEPKKEMVNEKHDDTQGEWADWRTVGYDIDEAYAVKPFQTSGNFIHHEKRIVDDCYPTNNAYIIGSDNYSDAHHWYIKGSVYVYEQQVSAYTGSAKAYSHAVHLPLTITAASHGQLKLLNVKLNRYAYYYRDKETSKLGQIGTGSNADDKKIWVNNLADSYELNDVITWWDWQNLTEEERELFVEQTYVNCVPCTIGGTDYAVGQYVMADTTTIKNSMPFITYTDDKGDEQTLQSQNLSPVFRPSNNVSHDTGYVLTFDMDLPSVWDDYKTVTEDDQRTKISKAEYDKLLAEAKDEADRQAIIDKYTEGPTFHPTTDGVYGKREYNVGDIITKPEFDRISEQEDNGKEYIMPAYVATQSVSYTYNDVTKTINAGTAISKTEYEAIGTAQAAFAPAWVCNSSIKLADNAYLLFGDLKTEEEIKTLKTDYPLVANDITEAMKPAYICTQTGKFGGQEFKTNTNYSAIQSWCALSEEDRKNFLFNYDALDVLVDPTYSVDPEGNPTTESIYKEPYSDTVDMDYKAVFKATQEKTSITTISGKVLTDGATLTNKEFENDIVNDKLYYTYVSTANLNGAYFYVVKENFISNGHPYGKGQVVSSDVYELNNTHVERVVVGDEHAGKDFYYCYQSKEASETIKEGTQISKETYEDLPDDQQYFVIQGSEPTETSTLYVNRESDIRDATQEKVITVVYQYTYYESDDNNTSTKLTNELHVVNIRIQLQSGQPTIGILEQPPTVLPGNAIGLGAPHVEPGIYEVVTSGWELFTNKDDANLHRNGIPFTNNSTPVYWYQNQKNYIAFYSKTYLGKAYSNYVPLSVANYHDLDAVMSDTEHHLYVDRADVDRPCKIYINDYSSSELNALDRLKQFYDLSVGINPTDDDHAPLASYVKGGENLEFILRTDIDHSGSEWAPIGSEDQCFGGTLHGDGHTLSGLDHSLFGNLCGQVYNLGVTGPFKSAGIADCGDGYVENCWIKSTADRAENDPPANPVIGKPTRVGDEGLVQIVNCYYPESNTFYQPDTEYKSHGQARAMTDQQFYNGEVAYNLNGFYLNKRYYDHTLSGGSTTVSDGSTVGYTYLPASETDAKLPTEMSTSYYPADYACYTPKNTTLTPRLGYVEHRFYDGDFRYANGYIPETQNIRRRTKTEIINDQNTDVVLFPPIWPDDYLFFGQRLNYGHVNDPDNVRPHQPLPTIIYKSSERIVVDNNGNRVGRAPAYFRSKQMKAAHFNPAAVFATEGHQGMTAIDFTGHNDLPYAPAGSTVLGGSPAPTGSTVLGGSTVESPVFCPPLLDDPGLTSLLNYDLTKNLLVYTAAPDNTTSAGKTGTVASNYLHDQKYEETHSTYRTASRWYSSSNTVYGHWVKQAGAEDYVAVNDHMLLDGHDFNAPIAYQMASDKRMWYQREPRFVDLDKGWETVSLPFTAEVVTTQNKGELTHFYQGSEKGHEYWLRQFDGDISQKEGSVYTARFNLPDAGSGTKDYTNTFLWDYYYSKDSYLDQNEDSYPQEYYSEGYLKGHYPVSNYPFLTAATPYIVGFPDKTYYEFDLSGEWTPSNRYQGTTIASPGKQVIIFASEPGTAIQISDDELAASQATSSEGYTFTPTYMSSELPAGVYLLDDDGSSFKVTTAPTVTEPFRPYFSYTPTSARTRGDAERIVFGMGSGQFGVEEQGDPTQGDLDESFAIGARRRSVVVTSNLRTESEVTITNLSGITVATFSVQPGETVRTPMNAGGVYIVRAANGRYQKKLVVK